MTGASEAGAGAPIIPRDRDAPAAVDPRELRTALERVASEAAEVRETHISWVFLVGDRAHKLKQAPVLPFVDYCTAARRRQMCREEVRLNRALAPTIYLGVRAVVRTASGAELSDEDDSRTIDYVW